MLFDIPYSSARIPFWFLLFGYFGLITFSNKVRVSSNRSVFPSSHGSVVPCQGIYLVVSLLRVVKLQIFSAPCYSGLCYYYLCVNASRYSILSAQNVKFSALTFQSATQNYKGIHLDCLVSPQDCLRRCRGGHQSELKHLLGTPLALTICLEYVWRTCHFLC